MHAAMFKNPLPNTDRQRETLPPPSGPRAIASQLAAAAAACDAATYATIDIPANDVVGPVRVVIESAPTGRRIATVTLHPGDELVLGASPEADVVIADPTVSGRHCAVTHHAGLVQVIDLDSRNGVRLAGARVQRALCNVGSSFEIGRSVVRFEAAPKPGNIDESTALGGVVGSSPPMRRLTVAVRGVGPLRLPVLLRGESGSGKDVVARAVHAESSRAKRPFVVLNAATIRPELAESELFGHERGAFTGAVRERRGAFREAHQGTLFLDEIAALSLDVQAKLLRAVEQGTVRPLGGEADHRVDVRLIAATCEPLEAMVRERRFRADLYERLAVCVLRVPPLRDRPEDIPDLARHLLATSEVGARELGACALAVLRRHPWPGNVRELRNVLVQAAIAAPGAIRAEHVNDVLHAREEAGRRKIDSTEALRVFEEAGFNVSEAARRADLPRTTMRDLLIAAGAPLGGRKVQRKAGQAPATGE
jgi:transcriptional regulator with GAF, ATPase, and Fis domain